jgi:hypothetical protein
VLAVLCGKVYNCVERRDGGVLEPGYDSHVAEGGAEWVLFEASQVLPLFVIEARDEPPPSPPPVQHVVAAAVAVAAAPLAPPVPVVQQIFAPPVIPADPAIVQPAAPVVEENLASSAEGASICELF